jgi:hypothetical protein
MIDLGPKTEEAHAVHYDYFFSRVVHLSPVLFSALSTLCCQARQMQEKGMTECGHY